MGGLSGARLRTILLVAVAVVSAGAMLGARAGDIGRALELQSLDARFSIRGDQKVPSDVAVIQINDVTFDELKARCGSCARWPFSRALHAEAVDRLREAGAAAIAYDVQFTEESDDPDADNALVEAVQRARPRVVLATTEVDQNGHSSVFGGDDVLREIGARAGNAGLPQDPGGVYRRLEYSVEKLKTFAVRAAEVKERRTIARSEMPHGEVLIDYAGGPGRIETFSFSRLLAGRIPAGALRGRAVVVGAAAPSLQDVHPTPTSGDKLMSGPEIQANAIETVLEEFPLRYTSGVFNVLAIILLGVITPLLSLFTRPRNALGIGIGLGVAYLVGSQVAFNAGHVVPLVHPLTALVTSAVGSLGVHYLGAAVERQRTRDLFARFVPAQVVDQVVARTGEGLRLGGEAMVATVLFSDIRGFTTFSESHPPDRVIRILNEYLTAMSDAILDHGGTLTSYIGDGIMAVFGAPIEMPDHADRALAAAREMLGAKLDAFNEWIREEEGILVPFRMGVGLNTGPVMSGNVGSERRCEFTCIGDTVNTASRLEGMTKGQPFPLLFADSTRELLHTQPDDIHFIDELEVRGRKGKVRVWSLATERVTVTPQPPAPVSA
jgi:adenylate cyclase